MDQLEPLAYNVADLGRVAGIGRTTAYAEIAAGRLVATKLGRRTVVLRHDLEAFLAARRAESIERSADRADTAAASQDSDPGARCAVGVRSASP